MIGRKIPGHHPHVPVAAPLFPHQFPDTGGGPLHLRAGSGGLKQLHRAAAGDRLRPLLGEELALHHLEFGGLCRVLPVKGFHFTRNPLLFGQPEQLGGGAPGG